MSGKIVMVDTSMFIDFLRRRDKDNAWLYKLAKKKIDIRASILTHTELYSGKSVWGNVKAERDLEKTLRGVKLIGVSEEISKLGGKIRAKLGIDLADAIIAATAIENKLSLATMNQKHFKGIKGLNLTKQD
ncbi:PIN domain-containing protein [Patescibacteria group bacterium]|nr:PIN domain-containing protein [Patescibacteria group bacterium]